VGTPPAPFVLLSGPQRTPVLTHPRLRVVYFPWDHPGLNPQERIGHRIRWEAMRNRWFPELNAIWRTAHKTPRSWLRQELKRLCPIG